MTNEQHIKMAGELMAKTIKDLDATAERTISEINEGHITEALDRCHTIMFMTEELLSGHPAIVEAGQDVLVEKLISDIVSIYEGVGAFYE